MLFRSLCRLLKGDSSTAHVPVLLFSVLAASERALQAGANTFVAGDGDKDFMATDGTTTIYGIVGLAAAKRGTPPGGDGPFGSGPNRCMFGEVIFG